MASHISQMEQSISATWIIMSSLSEMQIFMNIREEIFISFQSGKDFHKIERNAFWPVKRKYKIPKCFRHTSRQSYICCLWLTVAKLLPKSLKKDFFFEIDSQHWCIFYTPKIYFTFLDLQGMVNWFLKEWNSTRNCHPSLNCSLFLKNCFQKIKLAVKIKFKQNKKSSLSNSHSPIGHYFFSYLLTWDVDLIKILYIMPQMW